MTELMSQTQLVEDTNRFGKHKAGYGTNRTFPPNGNSNHHHTTTTNGTSNGNDTTRSHSTSSTLASSSSSSSRPTPHNSSTHVSSMTYTVVLQPSNSQFPVKTLQVKENVRCRIGRQSNAKTIPRTLNGYFDSKVLSRNHALLWLGETGGVWIKDTNSSNGTFLNGLRLSAELQESEPYELKTGDRIEFGIDITGDDGSILYHKVACDVSIFNIAVEQMDPLILKDFNITNGYASLFPTSEMESSHQRRGSTSSTSSASTISYHSGKNLINDHTSNSSMNKRNKDWEMLIDQLEGELKRSQQVEKELREMKEAIGEMDKTHSNEDRLKKSNDLTISLQNQLDQAHRQLGAYAEKTRLQDLAISSAQKQLVELQKVIENKPRHTSKDDESEVAIWRQKVEQLYREMDEEKVKQNKVLMLEKEQRMDYEQRCLELEKRLAGFEGGRHQENGFFSGLMDALQTRSVQILIGVMMAVISTLIYALLLLI
ncbi:hypothetical protein BC941DRAFT_431845 [Chlamydoabsidia padenii]|nr:hypothetical protein BC941DRAFT_431845 [Chlamydoabsidia padenii]